MKLLDVLPFSRHLSHEFLEQTLVIEADMRAQYPVQRQGKLLADDMTARGISAARTMCSGGRAHAGSGRAKTIDLHKAVLVVQPQRVPPHFLGCSAICF